MSTNPTELTLVYRIDASNRMVWVNDAWVEFAHENHGELVMPEHVIGHDMMASISNDSVRQIYELILQRVRAGDPVAFNYRCDAPHKRRTFAMTVTLLPTGEVEFVSQLMHEETRPSIPLLEKDRPRNDELLHVCSWCQQVELPDGTWASVEAAVVKMELLEAEALPGISHGMCQTCHASMMMALGLSRET